MLFKVTYPNGDVEHENVEETGVTTIEAYINRKFGKPPEREGFVIEIVSQEDFVEESVGDETLHADEGTGNEPGE